MKQLPLIAVFLFAAFCAHAQNNGRFQGYAQKGDTQNVQPVLIDVARVDVDSIIPEPEIPFPIEVFEGSFDDCLKKAGRERKTVFVEFHAKWCLPCKQMEKTTFMNPQVQDHIEEKFVLYRIDLDDLIGLEIAGKYTVKSLPTMLFLDSRGAEIKRLIGYQSAKELLEESP